MDGVAGGWQRHADRVARGRPADTGTVRRKPAESETSVWMMIGHRLDAVCVPSRSAAAPSMASPVPFESHSRPLRPTTETAKAKASLDRLPIPLTSSPVHLISSPSPKIDIHTTTSVPQAAHTPQCSSPRPFCQREVSNFAPAHERAHTQLPQRKG